MSLPTRWHGTTFNVLYSSDPSQKNLTKAHLITSRDSFELVSLDWKSSLEAISVNDIDRVDGKKSTATLTMKPHCKFTILHLNTAPDPCDRIVEALTPSPVSKPDSESLAISTIAPSIRGSPTELHHIAVEMSNHLIQFFSPIQTNSPPLIDSIICAYRGRFPNEVTQNIESLVQILQTDIKRLLIVRWAKSIDHFTSGEPTPASIQFQSKIAQAIAATVRKVAINVSIQVYDLEQVIQSPNFPAGIEGPIRRIGKEAQDGIERDEQSVRSADKEIATTLETAVIVMLAGVVAGMYERDMKAFTEAIVEYTQAVVDRTAANLAKGAFETKQNLFLRDLLCLLDGKRLDDLFQWIYCLWELKTTGESLK
jgi:hypothetical protein